MPAISQDTWILNVAMKTHESMGFQHWCRIELPAHLSKVEAQMRAETITDYFHAANTAAEWNFTLTRWELRGHEVSF